MPVTIEDLKSFGAGALDDTLFGLPSFIAEKLNSDYFKKLQEQSNPAYEIGKTASVLGGLLIPGGAIAKGIKTAKGLKAADTALDIAKNAKSIDKLGDILKTTSKIDNVADISKQASKEYFSNSIKENILKSIKAGEIKNIPKAENVYSPRVKKFLENIESIPTNNSKPFSKKEALDIIYNNKKLPDGWYVHGKNPQGKFAGEYPIQYTRDIDVAKSTNYGTDAGVWISRPTKNAVIYDFTDKNSTSMDQFIKKLLPKYEKYKLKKLPEKEMEIFNALEPYNIMDNSKLFESAIRDSFSPVNIVDSAGAYDNKDFWNLFNIIDKKPDFIYTRDGAVVIPGAKNVQHINLSNIAGIKQEAKKQIKKPLTTPKIKTNDYIRDAPNGGWTKVVANDGRVANFTEYAEDSEIKKWVDSGMSYMEWIKSGGK